VRELYVKSGFAARRRRGPHVALRPQGIFNYSVVGFTGTGFEGRTSVGGATSPSCVLPVGVADAGWAFWSTLVSSPVDDIRVNVLDSVWAVVVDCDCVVKTDGPAVFANKRAWAFG